MDEEVNRTEDYNNQGIDVTTTDRRDAENCVLCILKEKIQNKSLQKATMVAEQIGYITPEIANSINRAKKKVEEKTRNPKYIDADAIKDDMQRESRTINDNNFNTGINISSDGFNQLIDAQFNQQENVQIGQQFNEQNNEQFEQQNKGQFRQQRNNDWER